MQPLVEGRSWTRTTVGKSLADTYRLGHDGEAELFLKVSPKAPRSELLQEKERLDWLRERLPVPDVVRYAADGGNEYLLLTALPGRDAASLAGDGFSEDIARQMGAGLRAVHAVAIKDCPFDMTLDREIQEAGRNVAAGLVNDDDFDDIRVGRTAQDLFGELLATRPPTEDLVFTHGDYCLPNVMIDGPDVAGFIDLGRAGVADRYKDIALAIRSLERNVGPGVSQTFLTAYGITSPDTDKVEYYKLLDEFW